MKPATAGGPYKVPRQNEGWRSIALAAAMHAVLLLFLWVGVSWQNNEPTTVQAEIWDMKVQEAAPAPPQVKPEPEPEPEPTPVVKAAPPKPVEAPPTPKEPDIALERLKAKKKLEQEKLEAAKEAKLKKEAEEKQAKLDAKKLADKKEAEQKLKDEKDQAETQLPTGEIIGVRKMKSSGSAAYDSAIENAIAKSSPLPKKKDGTVEREFVADFNMKDMH